MTGPIKALSWEFIRRLSLTVPLIIPMIILGPSGIDGLFWVAGLPTAGENIPPLSWHCVYLALGFMLIAVPLLEAYKGACHRILAYPVSNAFIATWMMVSAVVAVVGQELLIHWIYSFTLSDWSYLAVFGENSSLVGPCQPIFAMMISMLMAMFWSLRHFKFRKLLVCGVLVNCLIFWIGSHYYPRGFGAGATSWTTLTFFDGAVIAAVIGASWFVTCRGIARERCGDNVEHSFEDRVEVLTVRVRAILFPDGLRDHDSPEAAIVWNQWRQTGRNAALAAGFGLGTLLAILMFSVFGGRRGPEGIVFLLFLIPGIVGFLTGAVLGILAPPSSRERITMFLATSPVSDARLARGLLRNAWRTTMIAWGLVIIPGLLSLGAAIIRDGTTSLEVQFDRLSQSSGLPFGVMILPLALIGSGLLAWMLTATFAVLHWTGSRWLPFFFIVGILADVILIGLMSFYLEKETITLLREASIGIASFTIVVGSAWAFWTTFKRKMVDPRSAAWLLSFWVLESMACWFFAPGPAHYRLFAIGVLMLSVSPVAFAPLAISRNRHVA
jgi:hypothetical protein